MTTPPVERRSPEGCFVLAARVVGGLLLAVVGLGIIIRDVEPDGHVDLTTALVGFAIGGLGLFIITPGTVAAFARLASSVVRGQAQRLSGNQTQAPDGD